MKTSPVFHHVLGDGPEFVFWCEGCGCYHGVWVTRPNPNGAQWTWNNDLVKPTLHPSLMLRYAQPGGSGKPPMDLMVCHSFIRAGRIEYLSDSTHGYAGKVLDLIPVDEVRAAGG